MGPSSTNVPPLQRRPHPFSRPLERCPQCGSDRLDPIVENDTGQVHFLCANCGRCWYVELGFARLVTTQWCRG